LPVIGIDIAASELRYVILEVADGVPTCVASNKLTLAGTRDVGGIKAFQAALAAVLNEANATILAIKNTPERGQRRVGAAVLKMEALLLAQSQCAVRFITIQKLSAQALHDFGIPGYYNDAVRAALVVLPDDA
jgi:hypothetical protein